MTAPTTAPAAIGPALPSDLRPLLAFFARNSAESRRARFHGSLTQFPRRYLFAVICGEDGVIGRVARDLAADPTGTFVAGFATATPVSMTDVELAVWVDDTHRRQGIATRLLESLITQAAGQGFRNGIAYLETDNTAAMALARSLAGTTRPRRDGTAPLRLPLRRRGALITQPSSGPGS